MPIPDIQRLRNSLVVAAVRDGKPSVYYPEIPDASHAKNVADLRGKTCHITVDGNRESVVFEEMLVAFRSFFDEFYLIQSIQKANPNSSFKVERPIKIILTEELAIKTFSEIVENENPSQRGGRMAM